MSNDNRVNLTLAEQLLERINTAIENKMPLQEFIRRSITDIDEDLFASFVIGGKNPERHNVIFYQDQWDEINRLSKQYGIKKAQVVLTAVLMKLLPYDKIIEKHEKKK